MAKLIVYLAFIICCNRQQNGAVVQGGVVADVITDYKADKLWADDLLMKTIQVEESTLTNCDKMENGRLFVMEEKPLLLMTNTVNLMKWN
ncbi:Uncharacterized protein BM_BM10173 [Brugia malayi]|uniref:Bm10173 n=1 Tax=Brugia malayi TaxID=6279 RepID=A0A0J9XWG6_BRUMA|nr:Uncharacterized protein BM_BM10173 [Brugia malayi]CDP97141.1 Bm10173 [Brugia malayi]VIO96953.1 Uncharacterized protein BM_BM10173 [Brugia malayi]